MGRIAEVAEQYWTGAISPRVQHPFTPLLMLEEVAPGVAFVSSFANVVAVAGERGLTLVDTGSAQFAAQVHGSVRGWSTAPVAHRGLHARPHRPRASASSSSRTRRQGGAAAAARDRARGGARSASTAIELTAGYNSCINQRQFRIPVALPTTYR